MLNHKHFGFAIRKNPYRTPELILILLKVYSYHKKDRMLETYLLLLKMIKILKEEAGIVSTDSFSSNVLLFVQQYIDRHYQNHINLEALSELTHYNESYLSTQFKKTFGIGINEYLRNVRMEHALLDLMESDKKILEIAFQNGFESIQSFNRIFKKLYDETPKNYRERSREMVCPS
jgi:xylan 1,4-beta-xylosidase